MENIINTLFNIQQLIELLDVDLIIDDEISNHLNQINGSVSSIYKILSARKATESPPEQKPANLDELREKAIHNIIFPHYWRISQLINNITEPSELEKLVVKTGYTDDIFKQP